MTPPATTQQVNAWERVYNDAGDDAEKDRMPPPSVRALIGRIRELEARIPGSRAPSLFGDAPPFSYRFRFVWPALKNLKDLIKQRNGAMGIAKPAVVREAQQRIRDDLALELSGKALPIFGTDDVQRILTWHVLSECITVEWRTLGPCALKKARQRDLVNLGGLLDDAVQRQTAKAKQLAGRFETCPGMIYRNDAQIASTIERRVLD